MALRQRADGSVYGDSDGDGWISSLDVTYVYNVALDANNQSLYAAKAPSNLDSL